MITEFPLPAERRDPRLILLGPDGNLWFDETRSEPLALVISGLGRITPQGVITEFPLPLFGGSLAAIAAGPDGALWFTEELGNAIGRFILTDLLGLSPPTGVYVTTQQFDPTVLLAPGVDVVASRATFDGTDVTDFFLDCAIPGSLSTGGQTLRCPDVAGSTLGSGLHAAAVILDLADGTNLIGAVTWELLANSEP